MNDDDNDYADLLSEVLFSSRLVAPHSDSSVICAGSSCPGDDDDDDDQMTCCSSI